jgi:hypothetical protein
MTAADAVIVGLLAVLPLLVAWQLVQHRQLGALRRRVETAESDRRDEAPAAERWRRGVHDRIEALAAEVRAPKPAAPLPALPVPEVGGPPSEPPSRVHTFAGVGPGRTLSYRGGACLPPSPLPPPPRPEP